jgi:hypothetical protein
MEKNYEASDEVHLEISASFNSSQVSIFEPSPKKFA